MSVTLYVIDKDNDQMIVISDRRTSHYEGRIVTYLNDNAIKHHNINEKLVYPQAQQLRRKASRI
jgi:hypothetical protein